MELEVFLMELEVFLMELDFNAGLTTELVRVSGELKSIDHRPFSTTLVLKTIFGLLKYVSRTPTLTDPRSVPGGVVLHAVVT